MPGRDRPISFTSALSRSSGLTFDEHDDYASSRALVISQTEEIASKLEAAGVSAYEAGTPGVVIVGEITGTVEEASRRFRRLHLLPAYAQSCRRALVRELTYFLHHHSRGRVARYAVVTSGQRVPWFGDLREARAQHLKRLNRWASEARARYGIEILFRSCEMPTRRGAVREDKNGINLHTNIVYRPTRRISPDEWSRFLTWSRGRLGAHWRDCGALRDATSVVRYVLKMSWGREGLDDIAKADGEVGLDELEPDKLAWLHQHTYRSHLVRALGPFADFRNGLDANRERIETVMRRGGQSELRRVRRPQRATRQSNVRAMPGAVMENVILARLSARARFSDVVEPCTVVMNLTGAPTTASGRYGIGILNSRVAQARGWAERNRLRASLAFTIKTAVSPSSTPSCAGHVGGQPITIRSLTAAGRKTRWVEDVSFGRPANEDRESLRLVA